MTSIDEPGWRPRAEVTIGILTATPQEGRAMMSLVDDRRDFRSAGDSQLYRVGTLPSADPGRPHRVAVLLLPRDGTRQAAAACAELRHTFPGVRCVIMTGIAGGIPRPLEPARHVRLGDVVVATEGLVEDLRGLRPAGGGPVSPWLGQAARELQRAADTGVRPWERWLDPDRTPQAREFERPAEDPDVLYAHGLAVAQPPRTVTGHPPGLPKVHYGLLGAAELTDRDELTRGDLAARFAEMVAVEVAGSGIAAGTVTADVPWFVVRGVADIGELTGRNERWPRYASYAAAAYLRALLEVTPPSIRPLPLVPAVQQDHLAGLLRRLPAGLDLRAVWNAAVPDLPEPPAGTLRTPERAYRYLENRNADGNGLSPALIFLARLSEVAGPAELAADLRAWALAQAQATRTTGVLEERLAQRNGVDHPAGAALLIEVAVDGIDRDRCRVTSYRQARTGPRRPRPGPLETCDVPLTDLPELVGVLVGRSGVDPADVEVRLPAGLADVLDRGAGG